MSSFERRIGPAADVKELEYIAALHQTCPFRLRTNGTVSSVDVMRFLKSRSNINITHQHALRIVRGLGGGRIGKDVIEAILQQEEQETCLQQEETKREGGLAFSSNKKSQPPPLLEEKEEDIPSDPFGIQGQQQQGGTKKKHLLGFLRKHPAHENLNESDDDMSDVEHNNNHDNRNENGGHAPSNNEHDKDDEADGLDDVHQEDIDAEEFLDLVQIVSILLVPTLARAGKKYAESSAVPLELEEHVPTPECRRGGRIQGWFETYFANYKQKKAKEARELQESLDPQPATLIPDVLHVMLSGVQTNSKQQQHRHPPVVNAHLVKQLLLQAGEVERAADAVLVDKMVQAAMSHSGCLDEAAFVQALTGDLHLWKVGSEDTLTSSFYDVYGFESYREWRIVERQEQEAKNRAKKQQQVDESQRRLSQAGLVVTTTGTHHQDDDDESNLEEDDITVEDDIVPSMVGFRHKQQHHHASISSNASVDASVDMSVITLESMETSTTPRAMMQDLHDLNEEEEPYKLDRTHTPLDIDFVIDMHSSIFLTVLIFFFFMVTSLVYAALILQIPQLNPHCHKKFGCTLGAKVITWMVFAFILAGTGYFVIIPLSLGNQPTERSPRRLLLSFVLGLFVTWIPFLAIQAWEEDVEPPYSGPSASVNEPNYTAAQWICRFLGNLTCIVLLYRLCLSFIGNQRIRDHDFLRNYFSPSAVRGAARQKKAATRKMNRLLENAYKMHPGIQSGEAGEGSREEAMSNFVLRGESFEEAGGLVWTWKRLFSKELFEVDGVWIMSRLIIIQVAQLILIVFYGYSGILLVQEVSERAQKFQDTLVPGYPEWVYTFVPTPKQAESALYPAVGTSLFVMVTIFLTYIPSYVRTIFQFRCGVRPSLKSSEFLKYRIAVDAVYTNIGNAVFGMVGAGFIWFALIGLVLFLFIWPFSRNFMVLLVAWGLGLLITIVAKMVLVKTCRRKFYAGFYRTNPNAANLAILALECWYIGMGGGVLVGRFTQFILAACFYIGRIDVPFLSRDVSLFGYAFDYVPTNFVRDILVHEAHRHPYFERLLSMYLMKLKNDKFSSEAGACWRQLFVVQLMPWLIKHRVFTDKRLESLSLDHYNARRIERISSSASTSILTIPVKSPVTSPPVKSPPSPKRTSYHEQAQSLLGELVEDESVEEMPLFEL